MPSVRTHTALLLPLRLFTGWVFFSSALSKISAGWLERPELVRVLTGWIKESRPYGFFLPILQNLVIPNQRSFSLLLIGAELTIGVALIAGLFTRWASGAGLLLVVSYLLGRGDGASANPTAPFVVILATLLLTHSGRVLGADASLHGKVPEWLS